MCKPIWSLPLLSLLFFSIALITANAKGQSEGDSDSSKHLQFTASGGPLLPSKIGQVTENLLGWDVRGMLPTAKGKFELDFYFAQGNGTVYRTLSFDYRADLFEGDVFPAFVLLGAHGDFYNTYDGVSHTAFGWHFGGGLLQPLFPGIAVREDFRYRFGPGQSLLLLVGLQLTIN